MLLFERSETVCAPMTGINVEYDQSRNAAGDDANIGIGPSLEPLPHRVRRRGAALERPPREQWPLAARLDRQDGPASMKVVERSGKPFALLGSCHAAISFRLYTIVPADEQSMHHTTAAADEAMKSPNIEKICGSA